MSISLKNARTITVNKQIYKWKVSKNGVLHLVIFKKKHPDHKALLKIVVNYPDPPKKFMITPKEVREWILHAIENGFGRSMEQVYYVKDF